jgi:amidase
MRRLSVLIGLLAMPFLIMGSPAQGFQQPAPDASLQVLNARDAHPKGSKQYLIDPRAKPLIRVKPGEKFRVITEDAADGQLLEGGHYQKVLDQSLEVQQHNPPNLNPTGGPIYIEGCTKDDVVAVHIHSIQPEQEGFTARTPKDVADKELLRKYPQLDTGKTYAIKHLPGPSGTTSDGVAVLGKYRWDLDPFIGTLTLAAEREVHSTVMVRGPYGGNLDVRDFRQGSIVYLNSYNEGGLLYAGDCHASQADTEYYGFADESRCEYVLSVEVIKNKRLSYPRVKTRDGRLVALAAAEHGLGLRAIDAARMNLFDWLVSDYGVDPSDLYALMAAAEPFRIEFYQGPGPGGEWGDETVGMSVPESFIQGKGWSRTP